MAQRGPREPGRSPRWAQDGSGSPEQAQDRPNMGPRWAQELPKMGPRWAQNRSHGALEDGSRKNATLGQRAHLIFSHFGALLGPSWGLLGPSWGLLGPSWGHLGAILSVINRRAAMFKKHRKTQVGMALGGSKMGPSWAKLGSSCDLEPS